MIASNMQQILLICFGLNFFLLQSTAMSAAQDKRLEKAENFFIYLPKTEIRAPSIQSSAYSVNLNSYVLHWEPSESTTNYYYLRYKSKSASGATWEYRELPGNATSYSFENLLPETKYKVQLSAVVSATSYSRTSISSFQTGKAPKKPEKEVEKTRPEDEDVPPAPDASSWTDEKQSKTTVYVNWYPKSNGKSPVLRYKLLQRVSDGKNSTEWQLVDDKIPAMSTSYEVKQLPPQDDYFFRLVAVNKFGESEPTTMQTKKTNVPVVHNVYIIPPDLSEVQFVKNSTAVKVNWYYNEETTSDLSKFQIICEEQSNDGNRKRAVNIDVVNLALREFVIPAPISTDGSIPIFQIKMRAFSKKDDPSYFSNAFECNRTCESLLSQSYNSNYPEEYFDEDLVYPLDTPAPANYDMAYFVSGVTFGLVVLVLAVSGIVYRHRLADQKRKFECDNMGALEDGHGGSKHFHQQVCDKVVSHLRKTQQIPPELFSSTSKSCCNDQPGGSSGGGSIDSGVHYHDEAASGSCSSGDTPEETNRMLDSSCHCAATGVAQLPWTKGHVF